MNELDTYTRFLESFSKAKAGDKGGDPKPGVLTRELLTRLRRIVLAPSVTTLAQVNERFDSLLDSLDDNEKKA